MMAALWQDALDDVEAACVHYGEAIAMFEEPGFAPTGTPNYRDRMAFLHAMQSGYTSFEAALRRLLAILDEPMPVGPEWHTALVRRVARPLASSRPAIIGPELEVAVLELMRFRHVAMHSYERFDTEKAGMAIRQARVFLEAINADIARFRAAIDPPG